MAFARQPLGFARLWPRLVGQTPDGDQMTGETASPGMPVKPVVQPLKLAGEPTAQGLAGLLRNAQRRQQPAFDAHVFEAGLAQVTGGGGRRVEQTIGVLVVELPTPHH